MGMSEVETATEGDETEAHPVGKGVDVPEDGVDLAERSSHGPTAVQVLHCVQGEVHHAVYKVRPSQHKDEHCSRLDGSSKPWPTKG